MQDATASICFCGTHLCVTLAGVMTELSFISQQPPLFPRLVISLAATALSSLSHYHRSSCRAFVLTCHTVAHLGPTLAPSIHHPLTSLHNLLSVPLSLTALLLLIQNQNRAFPGCFRSLQQMEALILGWIAGALKQHHLTLYIAPFYA